VNPPLWTLQRGDAAVIVNVPHAGIHIPPALAAGMTGAALAVPDTDWHVGELCAGFSQSLNLTLLCATHSRYVVDLNRDPAGAALYPGKSNTELCPTSTFHDEPIYRTGAAPDAAAIASRVEQYWRPYHAALAIEMDRVVARHGYVILLDAHSIISVAPRFFDGRLPDLNLGSADGASCSPALAELAWAVLGNAPGFSSVHNGRFKGGFITRHFGRPAERRHALQLEMAQSCYMDENRPHDFDLPTAAGLQAVLRQLVEALISWRPAWQAPAPQP
jgi:N-formylglutamate deformylase